jgi:predicted transcriptional regulator
MSKEQLEELREKWKFLYKLDRAPSQYKILLHLLFTGKTMTVKEIASEIDLTQKGTERAVAKLLNKNIIQRSNFRDGAYVCDNKEILLTIFLTVKELYNDYEKKNK